MSLTELNAKGGYSKDNIAFYAAIAQGGAGLVVLGESIIPSEVGKTHHQMIMLGEDAVVPSLAQAADAIHQYGAMVSIEISHGGAMATPSMNNGKLSWGPTGFVDEWGDEVLEMNEDMMNEVADAFAQAVETVRYCGLDMAMIHAAHGWLLCQFLSPRTNRRTDAYGGPFENRVKFPLMVLKRVRQRVGYGFPLELRIEGDECEKDGITVEEAVAFAKLAEPYVDLIHVSAGAPWCETPRMSLPVFFERGMNVPLAAAVKQAVKIPVVTVGGFVDPSMMEEALASGHADMIAIGRGLLADHDLPRKAKLGREKEIRQCIRCGVCNQTGYSTRDLKCSINPVAGREYDCHINTPVTEKQRVLVAGGGPGGMEAAYIAAKRGHEVILCEKSGSLGGALRFAEHVPFKIDLKNYANHLAYMCKKHGVNVRLNTPVTPNLIKDLTPDILILAIGGSPIIPPIPGVDGKNVVLGVNMFDEGIRIGHKVLILGGGLIGCENGLHLAHCGHEVTVVEMQSEIAPDAAPAHRGPLLQELEKHTTMYTGYRVTEITEEGITAINGSGDKIKLEADTVLLAAGMKALTAEVDELRKADVKDVIIIGDCLKPKKVMEAVRGGYDAAMNIGVGF